MELSKPLLNKLIRLTNHKEYPLLGKHPPELFIETVPGLKEKPKSYRSAAWMLFRRTHQFVTLEDTDKFLKARKPYEIIDPTHDPKNKGLGWVIKHFLDSGSFSLWTTAAEYHAEHGGGRWDFYNTPEFWQYVDNYCAFVKKYQIGIDYFANVDVIPNPELTWRNQRYIEKTHGIRPIPVVHHGTNLDWLKKYIDKGYEYIALGGLVKTLKYTGTGGLDWLQACFDMICDQPSRLPRVKIHGFGLAFPPSLLFRFPWYSVDSTFPVKEGAFGRLIVPKRKGSGWDFRATPHMLKVSMDNPYQSTQGRHLLSFAKAEQKVVHDWLDEIGVAVGKVGPLGDVIEYGVITSSVEIQIANIIYYDRLTKEMPVWPWPLPPKKIVRTNTLGVF